MPWNPMRVEQRIGRIDRLGQRYPDIQIVNLHYADTIEADVYRALRDRIASFEAVVGRLQPILARLPSLIAGKVLGGETNITAPGKSVASDIDLMVDKAEANGFDIDAVSGEELIEPKFEVSPLTMDDLDRVIRDPALLPPGVQVETMGALEFKILAPGMLEWVRVSTNPEYFGNNADAMELWSPGSPIFPQIEGCQQLTRLS